MPVSVRLTREGECRGLLQPATVFSECALALTRRVSLQQRPPASPEETKQQQQHVARRKLMGRPGLQVLSDLIMYPILSDALVPQFCDVALCAHRG